MDLGGGPLWRESLYKIAKKLGGGIGLVGHSLFESFKKVVFVWCLRNMVVVVHNHHV